MLGAACGLAVAAWQTAGAVSSAGAAGVPEPVATPTPTPVSATLARCHPAPLQSDRYATFAAEMTSTHRTRQMWVRFSLLERLGTDLAMHPAAAPGLGVWQKSNPGVGVFRSSQEVTNLPAPGTFRVSVSFRWYDAHHRVVMRAHRLTPDCVIPDLRPHLKVGTITRSPGSAPQTTDYGVTVRNEGLGSASGVGVLLTIDGAAQPQQTISELAAAGEQTLTFEGPRCSAPGTLTVTLDPAGTVDQTTRADDVKTVSCP